MQNIAILLFYYSNLFWAVLVAFVAIVFVAFVVIVFVFFVDTLSI